MKKTLLLIAALATLASAMAKPVEPTTASRIASHWLQAVTGKTYDNLTDITAQTPFHEFYVFTLKQEGGFILIAADDCVLPVLGYSETSTFPVRDMPAHVKDWMDVYEEQIAFYRERYGELDHGGSPEVRKQWDNLENGVAPLPPMATAVSPLVTTQWNQSPYYNNLCPYDNTYNERTVTGCVATAAAQIMKFWNHPATGYGSHSYTLSTYGAQSADFGATSYNWSSMPTSLSSSSSTAQVNAVATLMYHIGVAVEMDYGPGATGGSAAFTGSRNLNTPAANNAFVNYFKYKPTLHYELKADYTEAQWSAMLQADLNSGHPILYSGRDPSGGHAFVCDGYNNQGQFHFNWGWGGYYDGYYTMGDLHPGTGGTGGNSTYTFNLSNSAILGIEPMTNWSASASTTVNASATNTSYGSVTGGGTYNFADTITIRASANTGCRFYQWSDGSVQNPRTLLATGGAINVTANIGPLSGDTLGYCSNGRQSSLGNGSGNCYWGIKIPGSVVTSGHVLTAVEYYLSDSGTYDLTIYMGTTSPTTTVHSQSFTLTDEEAWNTMTLSTPVTIPSGQNCWITLHDNGVAYPCSYSFSSGNADGALWGSSFSSIVNSGWDIAFMIRGIFTDSGSTPDPGPGSDTSGCDIVLTVGDTTSTSTAHNPIHNYYRYSLSETIIDAAELQGLGQITSISYRYSHSSASTKKTDISIWIQPTTKTTFSSNSDLELLDANTAVLVYSGALNCTQGWNEFQFTTPYNYDGTSNLMIIIDDNSNDYDGNAYKFNTAASSGYKTLVWYSDSQNPDPNNNTYSGSKQYYQERVQMRLKGCEPQLDECTIVLPYTETFEEGSATLDCWTTDGPGNWTIGTGDHTASTGAYEGNGNAKITHGTTGNVTKFISPVLHGVTSGLQLTFAHIQRSWSGDIDNLAIYYRASSDAAWQQVANYTDAVPTWTVETVTIPGTIYQIAFEYTDHYGYGVGIDNVVFNAAPSCLAPTALTASDITADGATLTWTGDAASYNVYAVADGATTLVQNVTATSITLTGLNPTTTYTYGVRSVCGTDESDITTVTFTTACVAMTLPYTETFEATSAAAGCWSTDGPGTWQFGSYSSTGDTYEGSNYAYIRHASNGNVTKLISPVINASANATILQLTYAHIQKEWGGDQDELRVYYRTSASDSWVMAAEYTNDIQSWTVENVMIPTNTYQVAFEMTDGYGYGVAVDSVVVTEMTTSYCYPVSAVTVDNVTATGATISWTDDNNSGATYSIIGANGSVVATGLTATTYTFSGLTASTAYTFAVVTNCSADNASDPTLVTFTTDCAGGSCTVKIYATDGYGDGWDNSALTISQNGATVATYNMASQSQYNTPIYDTFQVSVCSGIPVSFSWTSGSNYDYEAGFQILDGNDTVLYTVTDASTLTDGAVFYTVADACGNNIPTPPALDSMKVTVAVNDVTMGTTVPAPGVHYFYEGDTCSVIAMPNTGYHLQGWGLYVTYNGTTDLDTTVATTATNVFDLIGGLVVAHGYGSYEWTVTAIFAADPTEPDTLAVTFAVNNASMGTTTPAPGTYNYPEGDTVYFSATPNSGYRFVGWAIAAGTDADTLDASYISAYFPANSLMGYGSVTMTALFEVEPTVPDTLFVTFAVDNPTMGTTLPAPGTYQYFAGDTVHFGSQATAGYRFLMWEITVGNEIDTFDASYANGYFILADVLMGESPVIFKAFFEPGTPDSTTITYAVNDASMGTTTPASGTYTIYVGDPIGATAIPAAGYSLSSWTLDVVVSGSVVNSYTSTDNPVFFGYVPQNFADHNASMILTANFVADSVVPEPDSLVLITAVNNPTMGTILPDPGSHVLYAGDTFSVRAVPNAGYHVESWHIVYSYGPYTIQDTVINLGLEEFFSLDTADYYLGMTMSFTANFAAGDAPVMHDSVTVITSVNDPTMGTITPAPGTHYYVEGDTVEFGIQPNPGYYIYALQLTATHPLIGVLADETLTDTSEIAEYIAEMAAEPLIVDAEMYGLTVSINVLFAAEGTTPNEYTVTVNYNATMGNVLSNGEPVANGTNITVIEGSSITFTANANSNYRFVAWVDNGDTIEGAQTVYTISNIDADHSVAAVFEAVQGIDDVDMDNVNIYSIDNMIVVRGAEGKQVVLFDVNGRMLSRKASATEHVQFRVDNSGVYLVKVANAAAKRVVVVR